MSLTVFVINRKWLNSIFRHLEVKFDSNIKSFTIVQKNFNFLDKFVWSNKQTGSRGRSFYLWRRVIFKELADWPLHLHFIAIAAFSSNSFDHNGFSLERHCSRWRLRIHRGGKSNFNKLIFITNFQISTIPSIPQEQKVEEITIRNSRFQNNDRGAVHYRSTGEIGPNLIIEQCLIDSNGYFLYGNISSSAQAMEIHLQNTMVRIKHFLYYSLTFSFSYSVQTHSTTTEADCL